MMKIILMLTVICSGCAIQPNHYYSQNKQYSEKHYVGYAHGYGVPGYRASEDEYHHFYNAAVKQCVEFQDRNALARHYQYGTRHRNYTDGYIQCMSDLGFQVQ